MKNSLKNSMIRSNTAFTLIEIMIVLGIIGILSAIAIPSILNPEHRLKKAARELMGDMQKTRSLAIRENKAWWIEFDATGYSIITSITTSTGSPPVATTAPVEQKRVEFSGYAAGVQYGHSTASEVTYGATSVVAEDLSDGSGASGSILRFDSRGRCNASDTSYGQGAVYLTYSDLTYAVVAGATGIVKILRWDGGSWQ